MCIYDNRGQNSSKLVAGVVLGRCLAMLLRRRCRSSIGHLIRPEGRRPRSSPASEPAARARAKILDHWIGAAGSCGALHLEMPHGDGAAQHAGRSATAAKHHGAGAESAGNMPRRAQESGRSFGSCFTRHSEVAVTAKRTPKAQVMLS